MKEYHTMLVSTHSDLAHANPNKRYRNDQATAKNHEGGLTTKSSPVSDDVVQAAFPTPNPSAMGKMVTKMAIIHLAFLEVGTIPILLNNKYFLILRVNLKICSFKPPSPPDFSEFY